MLSRLKRNRQTIVQIPRKGALDDSAIKPHVAAAESVLDIGAGIRPQTYVEAGQVHICVDAYRPYLDCLRDERRDDNRLVLLNAGWEEAMAMFPDASVDSVFALDVLEHLERDEGERLLAAAERIARNQVIVFTPLGFYPQSYEPGQLDRWGMLGGYWQTHRSGWELEDFGSEWKLIVCADLHQEDQHGQPLAEPSGAFWAIRTFAPAQEGG
jgi:Methyltransferase domain